MLSNVNPRECDGRVPHSTIRRPPADGQACRTAGDRVGRLFRSNYFFVGAVREPPLRFIEIRADTLVRPYTGSVGR